jgi:hypothetical protein
MPQTQNVPSEKLLIASIFLCLARKSNVTSLEPSLIIRCTVMRLLNTTVHVESRRRFCNDRNTSATPYSPEWVAIRICSMYFVFGGAAWKKRYVSKQCEHCRACPRLYLDLRSTFNRFLERASHVELCSVPLQPDGLPSVPMGIW